MNKFWVLIIMLIFVSGCGKAPKPSEVDRVDVESVENTAVQEEPVEPPPNIEDLTEEEIMQWEEESDRQEAEDLGLITFSEIAQHNIADDCWLVIGGQVFDVTEFITTHAEGQSIVRGCGQDATELFALMVMSSEILDSNSLDMILAEYFLGDIER
jgi:cytochrome b involved in lipid metabolism